MSRMLPWLNTNTLAKLWLWPYCHQVPSFPQQSMSPYIIQDWPDKPQNTQHPSTGLKVLGKTPNTLPLVWAPWGVVAGPLVTPCSRRGGHKWAALLLCHLMLYNITYKVSCSPLPSYARCCTTSHLKWAALLCQLIRDAVHCTTSHCIGWCREGTSELLSTFL